MKKILIVDDEPQILDLLQARLEANQYEVFRAQDGCEAIKNVSMHKPDLIIMDIMMPNLSGGDAVRVLQSDAATKNIPVIFLTVLTADALKGEEKKINVDGQFYISVGKSFKSEELLSRIRELLRE